MIKFLFKYFEILVGIILVIISALGIAVMIRRGMVSIDWLVERIDLIDAAVSVATLVLVGLAALASYYRFFRGRVFHERAQVKAEIQTFTLSQDRVLHAIDIEILNKGSVPIWSPILKLLAFNHGLSQPENPNPIDIWKPSSIQKPLAIQSVQADETEQFYAFNYVPVAVPAVTYLIEITSDAGITWQKAITVLNIPNKP